MNSLTPTLALVALAAAVEGAPHIVVILGDDVGWHGVGFHAKRNATEQPLVRTPRMDALVAEGMELDRHYVYKFCSPSRSSFQSGRLPVHVNVANAAPELRNASDPVSGYAGIPKSMTGVASVLSASPANYSAHMTGKWDAGMATPQHTPMGRGYSSWLGYYHHANDYYTEGLPLQATGNINVCLNQFTDLWGPGQGPAIQSQGHGAYEEEMASLAQAAKFCFYVIIILYSCHPIGCLWFLIGLESARPEDPNWPSNWITNRGIDDKPVEHQYLTSIYWAMTVLTTVGFGDIGPSTPAEMVFSCVAEMAGCFMFAILMGSIAAMITGEQMLKLKVSRPRLRGLAPTAAPNRLALRPRAAVHHLRTHCARAFSG